MNLSFWEYKELFDSIDFTIIGAGIVGSCTALFLREKYPDAKILVLERGITPLGASTRNAGFSCFGSISEILDDLEHMSEEEIRALIQLRVQGLNLLQELVSPEDMQYEQQGGYEVFSDTQLEEYTASIPKINQWVEESTGLKDCFQLVGNSFNFGFGKQMIWNQYEGQLNPALMMKNLHRKLKQEKINILFGSEVREVRAMRDSVEVQLENLNFTTKILASCTNAFSRGLFKNLDLVPARNQVLITHKIPDLKIKGTFHYDKGYVYFRDYGNRLLIGGARNIDLDTETTTAFGANDKIIKHLKNLVAEKILPGVELSYEYEWSGIIATGKTKRPMIEQLEERIYGGFRLGGMGVAIGSVVGKKLAALISQNS